MLRAAAAMTMLLVASFFSVPIATHAQPPGTQDPASVVDAFEAAARGGDTERALSFLAPNATLTGVSGRTYTGLAEIRGRLADARARGEYLTEGPGARVVTDNRVAWPQAFFAEDLRDLGVAPLLVTAEAVVENGRITQLTYRPSAESTQRLRIATAAQETMLNLQEAMAAHDIAASSALFAEDAVATTPIGTYTGRAAIAEWLQLLFDQGFSEQIVGPRQVTGDRVIQQVDFSLDMFKALGLDPMHARVEATIPQGRISQLDVALDPATQARLQEAQNAAIAVRFFEQINNGNLGVIDELLAPDFVDRDVSTGTDAGAESARRFFGMMREAFPDVRFAPTHVLADGDLVTIRTEVTGTNTGPLFGMAPTGARIAIPNIDIVRVRDGQIVEHWGVADAVTMMRQLGVIAPLGTP